MEKHDASVSEMVRDAAPDKTFHDELEGHLADYNVSRTLCALRCSQNMTQAELAKRVRLHAEQNLENREQQERSAQTGRLGHLRAGIQYASFD